MPADRRHPSLPNRLGQGAPADANQMVFNSTTGLWVPVGMGGDATMDHSGVVRLGTGAFGLGTAGTNVSAVTVNVFTTIGTAASIAFPGSRAFTYIAFATINVYALATSKDSDVLAHLDISTDGGSTFSGSLGDVKYHGNSASLGPTGAAPGLIMATRSNVTPTGAISTRLQVKQAAGVSGDFNYAGHTLLLALPPV